MLESPRGFKLNSSEFPNPRADYGLSILPSKIPCKRSESRTRAGLLCGISRLFFHRDPVVSFQLLRMKGERVSSVAFDRNASADLWRNTVSQIPSVFGRLVYLASLRNANTGAYEHHGLALVFGEDEANKAMKTSHAAVFTEWLSFDIEQQKADLDLYISGLFEDKRLVIETWTRLAPYRNLLPASVRGAERRLYMADFTALLELLQSAYGVASPDPDA
jgi:hypothetical protein